MADTSTLEALQADIESGLSSCASHRTEDVLAFVREHREKYLSYSVTLAELQLVAEAVEAKYEELMRFAAMKAFAELTEAEQSPWKHLARCYYSNVSETPETFAESLYLEYDGELPPDSSEPGAFDISHDDYHRPRECIEWYPPGKLPAHRAALLAERFESFPVPRQFAAKELTPISAQANEGRFWRTHLILENDRVVPATVLARNAWREGKDPGGRMLDRWFEDPRVCYLVEVYRCEEFEGGYWDLSGHALMTGAQLARYLETVTDSHRQSRAPQYRELIQQFGDRRER